MSFEFPFEYADLDEVGVLFYPTVRVEIKTKYGWRNFSFLVDTGADITTLPSHVLPILGIKKNNLKQGNTLDVGGYAIKTWVFSLPIRIGNAELLIAASAVENKVGSIPLLLGRKDIFEEKYNLLLDSRRKMTIISENFAAPSK